MNAKEDSGAGNDQSTEGKKKGSLVNILIWVVVAVVGIGAGFATPMLLLPDAADATVTAAAQSKPKNLLPIPDPTEEPAFIPFDKDIVANFNDPRFSRYLKMNFSVQVAKSQVEMVTKLIEQKHDVLLNWLIGHIADKRVEDLRGKQGTNRLRREIHDSFNQLLFDDGIERVKDVLFQELNIQ